MDETSHVTHALRDGHNRTNGAIGESAAECAYVRDRLPVAGFYLDISSQSQIVLQEPPETCHTQTAASVRARVRTS
jgi:hypothetical protein